MNSFFHATIDAKDGDTTTLCYFACNLLAHTMPGGRPFCIMDFIWNELRRTMNDPKKFLPSAPYIMYMIERVTMITFPKDYKHDIFIRAPVMHHEHLLFMPEPQEIRGLTQLHLIRVHLLIRVTSAHSSKVHSRAFSGCASPWLMKLMRTAGISSRSRIT
jgi:hypothetical protein